VDPYQNRRWIIILTMLIIGVVFIFRLLYLQVIDDKWAKRSVSISISEKAIKPARGLIYDRNGELT
jgi:penicillin-binding protein 2